jgi:leucyl-tRNA synthetase
MKNEEYKYVCVMFPYPSGNGLHIGHYYNYAIMDSYCKYLRYQGETVFQPFGYDSFGLPAENYAKKVGRDVADVTMENIDNFRKQMEAMQTDYEEILITSSEEYQEFTKKIFNILKDRGLAYEAKGEVNYCNSCETTLAREQVVDSKCERCKSDIEIKELENQWYFKITDYKDRLIDNLDSIDYPSSTINAQRKWLENQHDWCISRQRDWGCPIPVDTTNDTMDTFVDSSFYYYVYCALKGLKPKPVDVYVGGSEHACMHLIYARFINMVLFDAGYVDFEEPFKKVIHQGMILNNGVKMSKSLGNIVNPDDYDAGELRFYLMFIGHYFDGGSWDDSKIKGIQKFIRRFSTWMNTEEGTDVVDITAFKTLIFNYTEAFKFNKVVSSFMELVNKNKNKRISQEDKNVLIDILEIYIPNIKEKI